MAFLPFPFHWVNFSIFKQQTQTNVRNKINENDEDKIFKSFYQFLRGAEQCATAGLSSRLRNPESGAK